MQEANLMSLEFSPTREKTAGRVSDIAPVLISDVEAARILGCSRATIWRRVADKTLPQPIKVGGLTRWVVSEVQEAIEKRIAMRDAEAT